jgi:hypothetical protein
MTVGNAAAKWLLQFNGDAGFGVVVAKKQGLITEDKMDVIILIVSRVKK